MKNLKSTRRATTAVAKLGTLGQLQLVAVTTLICSMALGEFATSAAPAGAQVVRGHATFTQHGATTTIHAGKNAIINYSSFDILAGETVRFVQPNARSRVLNRVFSDLPTRIMGDLLANGRVYIVNPAGIHFGHGSHVSVGGLVAAAGQMSNRDFLRGIDRFTQMDGDVVNDGRIEASRLTLAGEHVANHGDIESPAGLVTLVAGDDVLVGERNGHVFVNVGKTTTPEADTYGVENSGTIRAAGGRSILAAGDLYSLAVANSGTVRSRSITLEGQGSGVVRASGQLDASDSSATGHGGTVKVLGEHVAVLGADIDASGSRGGGTVLIGGDYHGEGAVRTATHTIVDSESTIKADATTRGDGGKVIVWSDEVTGYYGSTSARGGAESGDGGFVEISSARELIAPGEVSLAAPHGESGTLLYDPLDIVIFGGNDDGSDVSDFRDDLLQHDGNVPGTILFGDEDDFFFALNEKRPAAAFGGVPFVIYESEIEGTDANIILEARRSISVNGSFQNNDVLLQNNRSLTMRTRNGDADGYGGIDLTLPEDEVEFRTQGRGEILLEAGSDGEAGADIFVDRLATAGQKVTLKSSGRIFIDGAIDSGSLDASGPRGVFLRSGSSESHLVQTAGNQVYRGPVILDDDVSLNSEKGDVRFQGAINSEQSPDSLTIHAGRNVTLEGAAGQAVPLGSLTISGRTIELGDVSTTGSQDYQATRSLTLNSTYSSSGGDIRFNANGAGDNSIYATIVKRSGDLDIQANRFVMGQNQKLVVSDGNLVIAGATSVAVGDLAASGVITVASPSITLLNRGAAPNDTGLDFLARNITFSSAPVFGGSSANQTAIFLTTDAAANVPLPPNGVSLIERAGPAFIDQQADGRTLDPTATPSTPGLPPAIGRASPETVGPAVEAPTVDFVGGDSPGAAVGEGGVTVDENKEPVRIQDLVGLVLKRQLMNLGIEAREATDVELARSLQGQGLYEQLAATASPEEKDYVVVDRRVSKPAVWNALNTYWGLFFNGHPAAGGTDRTAAIQQTFTDTFTAYVEKTQSAEPGGFRNYLETSRDGGDVRAGEALAYLAQTRKLLDQVRRIGLTRPEAEKARNHLLTRKLSSPVVEAAVLQKALEKPFGPETDGQHTK